MHTLIICIGNKARGDDGAGRRVAELLEGRLPGEVKIISRPQLDVVMTDDMADAEVVMFVDAERRSEPPVVVSRVEAGAASSNAHSIDPSGLVALAMQLYRVSPEVRLISLAAPEMPHAEGLSETAKAASEEAAFEIVRMLGDD